jgi:hypothetical protein
MRLPHGASFDLVCEAACHDQPPCKLQAMKIERELILLVLPIAAAHMTEPSDLSFVEAFSAQHMQFCLLNVSLIHENSLLSRRGVLRNARCNELPGRPHIMPDLAFAYSTI